MAQDECTRYVCHLGAGSDTGGSPWRKDLHSPRGHTGIVYGQRALVYGIERIPLRVSTCISWLRQQAGSGS